MTPSSAGQKGGLVRSAAHGTAERREWAAKGGRVSMGLEIPEGVPVVVLLAGKLVPIVELDDVQRRSLASLRGRELARLRWGR